MVGISKQTENRRPKLAGEYERQTLNQLVLLAGPSFATLLIGFARTATADIQLAHYNWTYFIVFPYR